jgi:hypothetical protein
MTTSTLRPDGTVVNAAALTGAATAHQALNDNSDASYATVQPNVGSRVTLGTVALPAGAVTKSITLRARARQDTLVSNVGLPLSVTAYVPTDGGTEVGSSRLFVTTTSFTTLAGATLPVTLTQTEVDGFEMFIESLSLTDTGVEVSIIRVAEVYLDLVYATQPTANVTYPTGSPAIATTNAPTFTWTHAAGSDGGSQAAFQVKVFSAAQYGAGGFSPDTSTATYDSGIVVGSAASHTPAALPNSTTYRVYVRTAQSINGAYHWSAWDFEGFSVAITTADVAQVVAIADSTRARILVEIDPVQANTNKHTVLELQRSIDNKATWEYVRPMTDLSPYRAVGDTEALALATDLPGTSGNYLSTPDTAALDIVGDLTLVAHVAADDWTPATAQTLIGKWASSGNNRSYMLLLNTDGSLSFLYGTGGGSTSVTRTSTANLSTLAAGAWKWIAVTVDVDNGAAGHTVRFWTSDDGVTWTILGSAVTTAGVIALLSLAAAVEVGSNSSGTGNPFAGLVRRAQVRTGIGASGVVGGTVVADYHANGAASYTDPTGKVWTANGLVTHTTSSVPVGDLLADYETGNAVATHYRARLTYYNSGLTLTSAWVETAVSAAWTGELTWLKNLSDPTLNTTVRHRFPPTAAYPARFGVFNILSREKPIAVTDTRLAAQGALAFVTLDSAEATAMRTLLKSAGVLLVQTPPTALWGDKYVWVGDVQEQNPSRILTEVVRYWAMNYAEVDAP